MGYSVVPNIKDEKVVCQKPCEHRDCHANKSEWMFSVCTWCKMPMLPGQNYYYDLREGEQISDFNAGELSKLHIHAGCMYDKSESRKEKMKL
jgi:Zn-finger protein